MNFDSSRSPVWQLPVAGAERTGNAYINPTAKYHCFVDALSLCGKYSQCTLYYDDGITIEGGVALQLPHSCCSKCYRKWKRNYRVEG